MGTDLTVYKSEYQGVNKQGFVYYTKTDLGTLYSTDIIDFFNRKRPDGMSNCALYEFSGHDFHECLQQLKDEGKTKAVEELERFITREPQINDDEEEYYELQLSW